MSIQRLHDVFFTKKRPLKEGKGGTGPRSCDGEMIIRLGEIVGERLKWLTLFRLPAALIGGIGKK
eukprot:scaffold7610_cov621-Pinguiococcus_pyrenoidosus.AAC.1